MANKHGSPLLDGSDFTGRLDLIEQRLAGYRAEPLPGGLTSPDEDTGERWEAAQVWAHMAEFVDYWQEQIEAVIAEFDGNPVPFGRTKRDPGRIAAIEVGRHEPIDELIARTREAVATLRRYLGTLGAAEWNAVGLHETLGEMDVEAITERFLVGHLDEHLEQLDELGRSSSSGSAADTRTDAGSDTAGTGSP